MWTGEWPIKYCICMLYTDHQMLCMYAQYSDLSNHDSNHNQTNTKSDSETPKSTAKFLCKAKIPWASKSIFHLLQNPKILCHVHNSLSLFPVPIQINPIHAHLDYLFKINFNISLALCLGLPAQRETQY